MHKQSLLLTHFQSRVIEIERKKLRAIQEKLPQAIEARAMGQVVGLAQAAERVAARLLNLLDNTPK